MLNKQVSNAVKSVILFAAFFFSKFQNFMVYLDDTEIRIMSKLLPGSANKYVLRTHFVVFCVLFQRGNVSTLSFVGGKLIPR